MVQRTEQNPCIASTAGPWYVGSRNGSLAIVNREPSPSGYFESGLFVIAKLGPSDESEANARLIARAPTMSDALTDVEIKLMNFLDLVDDGKPVSRADLDALLKRVQRAL